MGRRYEKGSEGKRKRGEKRGEMRWRRKGEIMVRKERPEERSGWRDWRRPGNHPATEGGSQRLPGAPALADGLFQPELNWKLGTEEAGPENQAGHSVQPRRRRVLESRGIQRPLAAERPQKSCGAEG